jgi:ribosome maturation factor RimP
MEKSEVDLLFFLFVKTKVGCKGERMAAKNIATTVEELLRPTVEGLGYVLWDVEFTKIAADYHLIVTIDREGGIWIEDCEKVHRAIDPILDEADPIDISYRLEVSSPGVERVLRRESHYVASVGERVEIRLFAALDGAKVLRGRLAGYENGTFEVEKEDGTRLSLAKESVSKIGTVYFD